MDFEFPEIDMRRIRIGYHRILSEDPFLYVKRRDGKEVIFILSKGVLEELARTPRGDIKRRLHGVSPEIVLVVQKEEIKVDCLHVALCRDYFKEEERRAC